MFGRRAERNTSFFRLEDAILAQFRNVFKDVCAFTKCRKSINGVNKYGKIYFTAYTKLDISIKNFKQECNATVVTKSLLKLRQLSTICVTKPLFEVKFTPNLTLKLKTQLSFFHVPQSNDDDVLLSTTLTAKWTCTEGIHLPALPKLQPFSTIFLKHKTRPFFFHIPQSNDDDVLLSTKWTCTKGIRLTAWSQLWTNAVHKQISHPYLSFKTCYKSDHTSKLIKLSRSGDVELNPGPKGKLTIGSYNIRGCNNYSKLKRITNFIFKLSKSDRFIFSLQESHISDKDLTSVRLLWRQGLLCSPSLNNARGVLTFYSNSLFDNILYEHSSANGRSTWIIGTHNNKTDLFVSIYAPNSGKNLEFYASLFKKIHNLANQYCTDSIFLSGDFNVVISGGASIGRITTKYEARLAEFISKELASLGLDNLMSHNRASHTWKRGLTFSTLDYVFGPSEIANLQPDARVCWGIDKSDHAGIIVNISFDLDKGPGMFRPNLSFLDDCDYRKDLELLLITSLQCSNPSWDPHMKLEYTKVMIRSIVSELSLKYKKRIEEKHSTVIEELSKLNDLKRDLASNPGSMIGKFISINDVDLDILLLEDDLTKLLESKTKMLAATSRIKWLELGERSNKYFLNLNKSFQNKSFIKCFMENDTEFHSTEDKINIAYEFYSKLYAHHANSDPSDFLDNLYVNSINPVHDDLTVQISKEELTSILKNCGDTAAGPDGVGYKLIKACWNIYAPILLESWNHGLVTGILAPSHRNSVICLLEKKNKDRRYIQNLRPISLSNCDIKLITKVLTKRFNKYLPILLNPHQTAYIKGRQVHDNLRGIELIKEYCQKSKVCGFLVSLDARKAFDSVDHSFITKVLEKFQISSQFIKIFKLLYNDITAQVLINGHLTNSFPIERSVKQGDALSCVLFILCMETLIASIEQNPDISAIATNNLVAPKVLAYADDIAVMVSNARSISSIIQTYERFSHCSGLYLNIDKTEILRLDEPQVTCLEVQSISEHAIVTPVQKLVICGKMFSNNRDDEYKYNVQDKITKLTNALESWRKRPLSIFGRNTIIKTFALSQIIYSMQCNFFSAASLAQVEKICFEYLWNKKPDKTKAYERIARSKLKLPLQCGGINAVDLESLDKALKIKQLIRSTEVKEKHFINLFQTEELMFQNDKIFNRPTGNQFMDRAIMGLKQLGAIMIDEIISSNEDSLLNKSYYDLIASEKLDNIMPFISNKPIVIQKVKFVQKRLGISLVGHLINEFKFPSNDTTVPHVNFIISNSNELVKILATRKKVSINTNFRDGLFLASNIITPLTSLTTKAIRTRLMLGDRTLDPLPGFAELKKIIHPKERETVFLMLHNAILSNQKLYNMKLIVSPLCQLCNVDQTIEHIFELCANVETAVSTLIGIQDLVTDSHVKINVGSLIKRTLFLKKDKTLNPDYLSIILQNRISDIEKMGKRKSYNTKLAQIKFYSLNC